MRSQALRADILMLITAMIWGTGFVAQRLGMDHIGPFLFTGLRFALGALALLPLLLQQMIFIGLINGKFAFSHSSFAVSERGNSTAAVVMKISYSCARRSITRCASGKAGSPV